MTSLTVVSVLRNTDVTSVALENHGLQNPQFRKKKLFCSGPINLKIQISKKVMRVMPAYLYKYMQIYFDFLKRLKIKEKSRIKGLVKFSNL